MITLARQARKLAAGCGTLFAAIVVVVCTTSTAQQISYQVIAPDIVPQGEEFTIRVVESTDAGQVPIRQGNEVVVNGTVLPALEGGKVRVPGFVKEAGNQFLFVAIPRAAEGAGKIETITPVPQHVEVVSLLQQPGQLPSRLWHVSELSPSGSNIRVDGQGLSGLRSASLQGANGTNPLNDSVGSSLQQIYRCPPDLPKGSYHFVAQDASGHPVEAPNATTNATLSITGTQIRKRGQRGQFVVSSDVEGDVQLSGGEPNIQLDTRMVHVSPNKTGTVKFTALQVGNYHVQGLMLVPDAPPANAPRADAHVGKLQTYFHPGEGKTSITAPITITGEQGQAVANSTVDMALVGPQGVQYNRLTTDKNGHATFLASLTGQVAADVLELHCFRVVGHLWNKQPKRPNRE